MSAPLPWLRVRTGLHREPRIGRLKPTAFKLVICIILAGTSLTTEQALWDSRGERSDLEELVEAGAVTISADGMITLADWVGVPVTPSTQRVRQYRERKRAAGQTAPPVLPGMGLAGSAQSGSASFQPVSVESPPDLAAVPAPGPVDTPSATFGIAQATATDAQVAGDTQPDLIFPAQIARAEQTAMRSLLAGLQQAQAQAVLDELAGQLEAGKAITNRLGWIL